MTRPLSALTKEIRACEGMRKVKHQRNKKLHPSVIPVIVIDYNILFRFKIPEIKIENVCIKKRFQWIYFSDECYFLLRFPHLLSRGHWNV